MKRILRLTVVNMFRMYILIKIDIQWGSEIRPSLDFKWSKTGWVAKWSGFRMGSEIRKPNHLKFGQMAAILFGSLVIRHSS